MANLVMTLFNSHLVNIRHGIFSIVVVCCCVTAGCRQQFAADDLPVMKRELEAIVKATGVQPDGNSPTLAKDAVASVGVFYQGKDKVALVASRVVMATASQGYGRGDLKLKRSGGEVTQTFCHDKYPHRFVTWTTFSDAKTGSLTIYSEGYKNSYESCSTAR